MIRKLSLLIPLAFLHACTTQARVQDPSRAAGSTPDKLTQPAPAPEGPAAKITDASIDKTCRSPLPICFDVALKVCRDRDYLVRTQERTGDQAASISAHGRSFELTMAFARTPANQTRVTLRVQGRALPENRDEASSLIDKVCEALLEPRD